MFGPPAGDIGWVRLPGVLDGNGRPAHEWGVTACPGVYFTGVPWLSARRSGLVTGVEHDAPRIAGLVMARCRRRRIRRHRGSLDLRSRRSSDLSLP
jgi:putative flavoprotein involved in K+ transport